MEPTIFEPRLKFMPRYKFFKFGLGFYKKNFVDFKNFLKSNFDRGKFLKIRSSINLPCGHAWFHKKFGPNRFSGFDVYLIQTDTQTNKHPDRQAMYITLVCQFH